MNVTDELLILKYKMAGMSEKAIAAKLGITEEEVVKRLTSVIDRFSNSAENGYGQLTTAYLRLCNQYQLVGDSLKEVARALGNTASSEEVRVCLSSNPEESLQKLLSSFIILHPFRPLTNAELLSEHIFVHSPKVN